MLKTIAFLLLVLLVRACSFSAATAVTAATAATAATGEAGALLRFKSSVSGDPARLLSSWVGSYPCSWPGIACDASSRVVSISISAAGGSNPADCPRAGPTGRRCPDPARRLAGNLSSAVVKLSELRNISLPFHAFSGEIPVEIWRLDNLEVVDLEGNSFSGRLPSRLPPRLRVLNLAFNFFEGAIPPSFSNSPSLEILDLSGNRINGTVPKILFGSSNLRALSLSFNLLQGPIPLEAVSNCSNLEHLDLSGNFIVGGIPRSLGNCSKLQSLLLFLNLFDEVIPPELGLLKKLRVLDVSRNSLSGSVPSELGGCDELSVLILSNPYIPVNVRDDSSYVNSDDFNYFQGGIPENVTSLPKLRLLWAPRGLLGGVFPSDWGACESLQMVHLGQNVITGEIPRGFGACQNLRFLNLSSNKLAGTVSGKLTVPCLDVVDISRNHLSGSIPNFDVGSCPSSLFPVDDLASLYYSFFTYKARVGISLPYAIAGINSLIYHNFGSNDFNGSLPSLPLSVSRLGSQTVYAFIADGNKLVGPLMDVWFEKCGGLNGFVANLTSNLISGQIPESIGSMCNALMAFEVADNQIAGMIPQSFGQLGKLVVLDLGKNHLQGFIPASLGNLKGLKFLSLANNNLTGGIPRGLAQLHSLTVLDLSSNSLSGEIPGDFVSLTNLTVLLLDKNKLSGRFPAGLASLALTLSMFNVSYNNLSGSLPQNGSTMRCDSVLGNPLLQSCHIYSLSIPPLDQQGGHNGTLQSYAYPPPTASPTGSSGFDTIEIASLTSAAAIVSVLLALIGLYLYTRKCAPRSPLQASGRREVTVFTDIGVPLTYESVVRATGNFNASNCIGSGGFGATYKAEISPGVLVAIKRLSVGRFQGVQQFHAEIKTLGRWRHPNLVTLIGYHVSEAEMFLIYNYLPGGNLERFIQERYKRTVDWRMLHKIAFDVARALAYLHDHCVPRILHRDVKPSNILLDNDFNAYLSDFGLARLLGNSETHATTGVAGTFGYVAPEYAMTCRVSDKADVYSYGVVLLELISDKKALDPSFSPYGNGFNIVAWACMLLRQGRAREFFVQGLWDIGPHDDLVETLHLAVMCTVETLSVRPTMKQVVQRLKQLQPPFRKHQ